MEPTPTVALVVLTGFLGSGKTTLLNRLLKTPSLAHTAVVINEFGEVAIDHLLVEQAADGIVEIGGGCLCCTVRGELVDTLLSLTERRPALDRVVVETSGLADPVPMLQSIIAHPTLSRRYRLECVVTIVDAMHGAATLDAYEEARQQVTLADQIVVSKADLAVEEDRRALMTRLSALNSSAELLDSRHPAVVECLLRPALDRVKPGLPGADHHGHDHDGHDHHHDDFRSVSLSYDGPLPASAIENFLDLLTTQQGEEILRIKGLAETSENPGRPLLIQGAQKLLHPPELLGAWPDGTRGTRIVVIGRALDTDYVRRLFAAFTGQTAIDTPDRAALERNPLSIPGIRR
ncbi:GTP-binding protein [Chelativorans sp. AA-79]|uniref:CobW family GTP-binding protein n=1 Tax=Chelativorans sp. AA-79 TaxID=3028735 RepID=UPI0023F9FA2D|nr:GTP-binding protein [Chelativorans sp. AA-79]WEX10086.1 GTP-binding protein [Chelativorans sp. AA-79]